MCNFLHPLFGIEKWKDTFCLAVVAYFGRKELIHFYLQLYSLAFRNRKSYKRFSRLKRRRESVATGGFRPKQNFLHLHNPYKRDRTAVTVRSCNLRRNRRATGARIWGFARSKIIFGKSVTLNILKQSTGLTFTTSSLARDDYG